MNGFQSLGRDISAHEIARTGGKKTANSIDGKTIRSGTPGESFPGYLSVSHETGPIDPGGDRRERSVRLGGRSRHRRVRRGAEGRATPEAPLVHATTRDRRLGAARSDPAGGPCRLPGRHPRLPGLGRRRQGAVATPAHAFAAPPRRDVPRANWTVSMRQIRYALHIVGHKRVLVLVTPREVGGYGGSDAANIRRAGRRYPDRVLVLDWVRYTAGHPNWFAPDGLHLGYGGA